MVKMRSCEGLAGVGPLVFNFETFTIFLKILLLAWANASSLTFSRLLWSLRFVPLDGRNQLGVKGGG